MRASPLIRSTLVSLYSFYFTNFLSPLIYVQSRWLTWYAAGRHYDAEIDPFRLLWIDPAEIQYCTYNKSTFDYPLYVSEVNGGEWDKKMRLFTETSVFEALESRFIDGVDWEDTAFYRRRVKTIKNGKPKWGCYTEEEFRQRCKELDALWKSIRRDGFKSQRSLRNKDDPISQRHTYRFAPELKEITVDISRDGEFLFNEGRHRLAIAKLLDVSEIPVRVKCRHKQWQKYRDAIVNGETEVDKSGAHPDLEYL